MDSDGINCYSLLCVKLLFILVFQRSTGGFSLAVSAVWLLCCNHHIIIYLKFNFTKMHLIGKIWKSSSSHSATFHHSLSNAVFIHLAGSTVCDNRPCVLPPLQSRKYSLSL